MIMRTKKPSGSQIVKVQPQGVLINFCLIFYQFRPDVDYKSVAYKKAYSHDLTRLANCYL